MRYRLRTLLIILALGPPMIGLAVARAEISPIPGDFGWRQSVPLQLLNDYAVVADLGLTAETARKLQDLDLRLRREAPGRTYSQRNEKLEAARNHHADEINTMLTAEQQVRLHQIHLQKRGIEALSDPTVAKEVRLSPGQQAQIYAIHRAVQRAEMDAVRQLQKGDKSGEAEWQRVSRESTAKILSVLTDEQRTAFQDLKGKSLTK